MHELGRAQIHCDTESWWQTISPSAHLQAYRLKAPAPDLMDEPRFLGDRDELSRSGSGAGRIPAHQCLRTHEPPIAVNLRLVVHGQFRALECLAQARFEGRASIDPVLHFRTEDAHYVSSRILCGIERHICRLEKRVCGIQRINTGSHTDAHAVVCHANIDAVWLIKRHKQLGCGAFGRSHGSRRVRPKLLKQHNKLITTKA